MSILRKVFLHPGDFVFAEAGTQVHTILGSCVAICLWHPYLHIGGMCHFILPSRPTAPQSSTDFDGRFGEEAMCLFDQAVSLHQTDYPDYQAKVFGGGSVKSGDSDDNTQMVGWRNIEVAKRLLQHRHVEISAIHRAKTEPQRIAMDFATGNVWVKEQSIVDVDEA